MAEVWNRMTPSPKVDHLVKLAIGPKYAGDLQFTEWETLLAEIITGNAFGVDRMDYLLRDSYHAGVAYGRFDHYRLIDTLRILPKNDSDRKEESPRPTPTLGVELGGLHSAEAMILARYYMFTQLYFHHVRRVYDFHLQEFLKAWRGPTIYADTSLDQLIEEHIGLTDNEVLAEIRIAARQPGHRAHEHAIRIQERAKRFRKLYDASPGDLKINIEAANAGRCCGHREIRGIQRTVRLGYAKDREV